MPLFPPWFRLQGLGGGGGKLRLHLLHSLGFQYLVVTWKGDVQPADDSGEHVLKSVPSSSCQLYRRDNFTRIFVPTLMLLGLSDAAFALL